MKKRKLLRKISAIILSAVLAFSTLSISVAAAERTPAGFILENVEFMQKNEELIEKITDGLLNFEESIVIEDYNIPITDYTKLRDAVLGTHPELFFVDNISYRYYTGAENIYAVAPIYAYSRSEAQSMLEEFYTSADYYLAKVDDSMSDFEKALILHDELVINSHYHIEGSTNYTEMVEGWGRCENYAEAYAFLLAQVGIKSEIINSASMNHEWLKVCIDGEYYNVDITWDDPAGDNDGDGYYDERIGKVEHTYFLLSDEKIQSSDMGSGRHYGYESFHATSAKYDNYLFHDYSTQLPYVDGEFYAVEQSTGNLVKYNEEANTAEVLKNLPYRWSAGGNYYWRGNFSSLAEQDGILYYNSPDAVYSYNISDGTSELIGNNTYDNDLYGLRIMDGKIYGVVAESPNVMGKLEYICDLPEKELELGDVNGDGTISIVDATEVQRYIAELSYFTPAQLKAADMNGDREINITDATQIQINLVNQ